MLWCLQTRQKKGHARQGDATSFLKVTVPLRHCCWWSYVDLVVLGAGQSVSSQQVLVRSEISVQKKKKTVTPSNPGLVCDLVCLLPAKTITFVDDVH